MKENTPQQAYLLQRGFNGDCSFFYLTAFNGVGMAEAGNN
jgi:hypothetical protein